MVQTSYDRAGRTVSNMVKAGLSHSVLDVAYSHQRRSQSETLIPRLHDTAGCQSGLTFDNRFDNRVERTATVRSTG